MATSRKVATAKDDQPITPRVGLICTKRMCKHGTSDQDYYSENPLCIRLLWDRLYTNGLAQRCVVLYAKNAEDSQLALVHSKQHVDFIKTIKRFAPSIEKTSSTNDSVNLKGYSSEAASFAAGSVIEAVVKVAKGELDSAFAIVWPPGNLAEENKPRGLCLYNNVAIAAKFLLNAKPELGIRKILIVDWDVNHGNGTQKIFYKDSRVLFFSVHRHENGSSYPYGSDGSHTMTGEGPGAGYNINVAWEEGGCGNSDYIAVWDNILIPVAKEFNPDMIIISAGFDAAATIGGCCVTPEGYSIMLDKLMGFARGKIVMSLEGRYDVSYLPQSVQACVEVLLQDKPCIACSYGRPLKSTCHVIQKVRQALCKYWPVLAGEVIAGTTSQIKVGVRPGDGTGRTNNLLAITEAGKDSAAEPECRLKAKSVDAAQKSTSATQGTFYETQTRSTTVHTTRITPVMYRLNQSMEIRRHPSQPTSIVKGKAISRNDVQSHSAQNRGSFSASQSQPSCSISTTKPNRQINPRPPTEDQAPPSNRDPSLTRAALLVSNAPPCAASSASSKRARLNETPTTSPGSLDDKITSLLPAADFTRERENMPKSVQCLGNEVVNNVQLLSKQAQYHEGRAAELEKKLKEREDEVARLRNENKKLKEREDEVERLRNENKKLKESEDEVARLRNENKTLSAAREKAEESLDHEISTGEKFLKSEPGKERLNEVKKEGVDEFKNSEAFRNEILKAAENVYDQAIKACREMAFPR